MAQHYLTAQHFIKKSHDYTLTPSQRELARGLALDAIVNSLKRVHTYKEEKDKYYTYPPTSKKPIPYDCPKQTYKQIAIGLMP